MRFQTGLAMAVAITALHAQDVTEQDYEQRLQKKLASKWLKTGKWMTDWDQARALAKKTGRVIFAYFTRSYAP